MQRVKVHTLQYKISSIWKTMGPLITYVCFSSSPRRAACSRISTFQGPVALFWSTWASSSCQQIEGSFHDLQASFQGYHWKSSRLPLALAWSVPCEIFLESPRPYEANLEVVWWKFCPLQTPIPMEFEHVFPAHRSWVILSSKLAFQIEDIWPCVPMMIFNQFFK